MCVGKTKQRKKCETNNMTGQTTNGQTNDNQRTNKPTMPTKTGRKKKESLSSFIEKLSLLNEKKQLFIEVMYCLSRLGHTAQRL